MVLHRLWITHIFLHAIMFASCLYLGTDDIHYFKNTYELKQCKLCYYTGILGYKFIDEANWIVLEREKDTFSTLFYSATKAMMIKVEVKWMLWVKYFWERYTKVKSPSSKNGQLLLKMIQAMTKVGACDIVVWTTVWSLSPALETKTCSVTSDIESCPINSLLRQCNDYVHMPRTPEKIFAEVQPNQGCRFLPSGTNCTVQSRALPPVDTSDLVSYMVLQTGLVWLLSSSTRASLCRGLQPVCE